MNLSLLAQSTASQCTLNGQPIDCGELADKAKPFIGLGVTIITIIVILAIASFIFWLLMLIHAIQHNSPDRTTWIVVLALSFIFGFSLIAAIVYFLAEKKKAEQAGKSSSSKPPEQPK